VTHTGWAAPVVAVLKKDKESVRLCGDYQLTVNKAVKLDRYPIPHTEDILCKNDWLQSILNPRHEASLSTAVARR
jgi:hypothetical protein